MRVRIAAAFIAAMVMLCAAVRVFASAPETFDVCCSGPQDCETGKCCDPMVLELPDCSIEERTGYCRAACIPGER